MSNGWQLVIHEPSMLALLAARGEGGRRWLTIEQNESA